MARLVSLVKHALSVQHRAGLRPVERLCRDDERSAVMQLTIENFFQQTVIIDRLRLGPKSPPSYEMNRSTKTRALIKRRVSNARRRFRSLSDGR